MECEEVRAGQGGSSSIILYYTSKVTQIRNEADS